MLARPRHQRFLACTLIFWNPIFWLHGPAKQLDDQGIWSTAHEGHVPSYDSSQKGNRTITEKQKKVHATTFGKQSPGRPELLGDTYTKPWIRSARDSRTPTMFHTHTFTHTHTHQGTASIVVLVTSHSLSANLTKAFQPGRSRHLTEHVLRHARCTTRTLQKTTTLTVRRPAKTSRRLSVAKMRTQNCNGQNRAQKAWLLRRNYNFRILQNSTCPRTAQSQPQRDA